MKAKIPWDIERSGSYTLKEWEVDVTRSVLLILDMQRGYVDPDTATGKLLKGNYPEIYSYYYDRLAQLVQPNIIMLRDFFRKHGMEVFYTRMGLQLPEGKDLPAWHWRRASLENHGPGNHFLFYKAIAEYQLVEKLQAFSKELVLDKNSLNAFNSTPLDQVLRNMGLENIIITGILTNVAVESTARSAGDRGYNVIVIEDACAAYNRSDHENTMRSVNGYVVKTAEELIKFFSPLLQPPIDRQ